jgi:serine/threonine-protein kinase
MEDFKLSEGSSFLKFHIIKPLGEGRFSKVYLVEKDGQLYALKVSKNPEYNRLLIQEAQAVLLFNHPHLIKLYSYFHSKDYKRVYLLYEYADAGDLKKLVEKRGKLSPKETLEILKHIVKGLTYLHSKGYIHFDIKPENVLGKRSREGIIWKLGDFGLIKSRGFSGILEIKGTVGFIAPEVFRGEIHRSSDIYSLGCLIFYMLKGHHPFKGKTKNEEIKKNKHGIVELDKNIPEKLRILLSKMLNPNPYKRFRTAWELENFLSKIS